MHNFAFNNESAKRFFVTLTVRTGHLKVRLRSLNDNVTSLVLTIQMIALLLLAAGCATPRSAVLPPVTSEGRETILPSTVWLSEIQLTDPTVDPSQRESLQKAMTLSLLNYMKESGACTDANLLPGPMGQGDLEINITVSKYRQYMLVHPALFPLSILTATMYIWFNGPIVNNHTELQGRLTVKDSTGRSLATVSSQKDGKGGGGWWDAILKPERINTGSNVRLQFFHDLLAQVRGQMDLVRLKVSPSMQNQSRP